jgi:1-acyl-sn-glycerol-3-phosphate acyltransferase
VSTVPKFLRVTAASLASYLLGYPLTAFGLLLGCGAALVRWRGFIRVGVQVWTRILFCLVGRWPRVEGREHIRAGRAYLVVANHASMYDIPLLMAAVPGVAIMGRDYLTRIPLLGQFLKVLHYVPIDTGSARSARAALNRAAREIRGGTSVGIFPEGTRTATGRVQTLKRGFVTVLREAEEDILPVSLHGTFALKPKGKITMDPAEPIGARIGSPLPYRELSSLEDAQIMEKVKSTLERLGEGSHEKKR